jgi:hypothetical protein
MSLRWLSGRCVSLAVASLLACGQSKHHDGAAGSTGHAGNASSPAGSGGMSSGGMAHGGSGSGAEAGAADTGGDAGGSAENAGGGNTGATGGRGGSFHGAGTSGSAGLADMGGSAGTAGSSAGMSGSDGASGGGQGGTRSAQPGIVCGPWDRTLPDVNCAAGEVCVLCEEADANRSVRCAPNPTEDPEGYDAFRASCTNGLLSSGCDGPEDCPAGSVCQMRSDDEYIYAACSSEAPSCEAYCVACNSDADCAGEDRCVPNVFGSGRWQSATCGPGLSELLPAGDWLIGWVGGVDHFSWFHFTKDAVDPRKGVVKTLATECGGCTSFGCGSDAGTYEIVAENEVRLEFPESCTASYRFTSLSSPPETLPLDSQVVVSAQVTVDAAEFSSAQALLYPPGVGCSLDFSVCSYPPP